MDRSEKGVVTRVEADREGNKDLSTKGEETSKGTRISEQSLGRHRSE